MQPKSDHVRVNDLRIRYLDWGGDGQPIVMVHATGLVAGVWRALAEALRAAGYRPIAIDQRGHGGSDKPPSGYGFLVLAADVRGFLAALDLPPAIGIGLSGGSTQIAICASEHPGTFTHAVLIEPIVFPNHDLPDARAQHTNSMVNRTIKRRAVWASREEIFDSYHARPPFDTWRPDILRDYIEYGTLPREDGQVELACPPEIEAQIYDSAPNFDPWPLLRRLDIPVLVMRGETSEPVGPNQGVALRDALPQGELLVVEETGHFVPMDKPDVVEAAVLDFLRRTGA